VKKTIADGGRKGEKNKTYTRKKIAVNSMKREESSANLLNQRERSHTEYNEKEKKKGGNKPRSAKQMGK